MWNLDTKPLCGKWKAESWCEAFIRNLHDKPFRETFTWTFLWNLGTFICGTWELVRVEPLCGTLGNLTPYAEPELLRVEHLCGTLQTLHFYECNLYVGKSEPFMWNRGTFESGTCMWNLGVPEILRVEPWVTWTFKSGTCMWNFGEPEFWRGTFMWNLGEPEFGEPSLCGTLGNLNFWEWTFMWNLGEPEI